MSRRVRRRAPFVVVLLALAGFLAACQKPLPMVTVYGNGKSVAVDAAFYQFPGGPGRGSGIIDYGQAPTLKVRAGSPLLVDVPRAVARSTWLVAAFSLDATGAQTPLAGAGSVNTIHDQHTTRLSTAPAGVGDYYLQVAVLQGGKQTGAWFVKISTRN